MESPATVLTDERLHYLATGPLHPFADWPNPLVPTVSAGVYTVWDATRFLYVGMAGRSLTIEALERRRSSGGKRTGLFDRLNSHAGGRRSGDQFCVYVCDRLVLPTLTAEQIQAVGRGELRLDSLVRTFIRSELSYRFVLVGDGASADALERLIIANGLPGCGRPFLQSALACEPLPPT